MSDLVHSNALIWDVMGFPGNPFRGVRMTTADGDRVAIAVRTTVSEEGLMAIIGGRGMGKTSAVFAAMPKNCQVIQSDPVDVARTNATDMIRALLLDLQPEGVTVPGNREVRWRRLRTVLGQASEQRKIVLLVDDAHLLPTPTVRALKRLRELNWMGRFPLLAIILISQCDPFTGASGKIMEEIRLRADSLHMMGLLPEEAMTYATRTVGRVFAPEALSAIAGSNAGRNYLDLQAALNKGMAAAAAAGRKRVEIIDVAGATGTGILELAKSLGVSQATLAREIGSSPSDLNRVLLGERSKPEVLDRCMDYLMGVGTDKQTAKHPIRKTV